MVKKRKKKSKRSSISNKLDELLKLERRQLRKQEQFEKLEKKQIRGIDDLEEDIEDLEDLEVKLNQKLIKHPLAEITIRDIGKAFIGAFIGVVSHYAVLEGVHYAEDITFTRATGFFVLSYLIGFVFLYYTGFRKIKEKRFLSLLPLRLTVIYFVMIFVVAFVIYIFTLTNIGLLELYKQVAVVSLPGMIGASAADLIGE